MAKTVNASVKWVGTRDRASQWVPSALQVKLSVFSRYDSNSGGEREIQRTMLELLNQLDGFDSRGDVKVIMATNRIETLDPALIRPGRLNHSPHPCSTRCNHSQEITLSDIYLTTHFNVTSWLSDEISIYLYSYIYHG